MNTPALLSLRHHAVALAAALLLSACASQPVPPEWQSSAFSSLKGFTSAYLTGNQRIADLEQVLNFVSPDLPVLHLPAWDCLPYDRVSPGADASARRLAALAALASLKKTPHPAVIITTANAILQKLPPQK